MLVVSLEKLMNQKNTTQTVLSRWTILSLVFIFSINPSAIQASSEKNKNELVFGILPIVSTARLIKRFAPLAQFLSEKIGVPVRLETAKDFKTFMDRTNNENRYDLLFTAPHFYYLAQRKADYKAIVRVAAPDMRALIAVPKKSKIMTLADLKGHELSTTDSLALATLMIRAHLVAAGINPDKDLKLVNTPTHNASLLSAYKGVTDAGSLMQPPFKLAKKEVKQGMRVISITDGSPHMPIAVSSRMSKEKVNKIKSALINLNSNEKGRILLKKLKWPGFVSVKPSDYDKLKWAVEQLK